MATFGTLTAVMVLTVFASTLMALLAWRERPRSGATPLAAMLVGGAWWSAFAVFELRAGSVEAMMRWSDVQWLGVVVVPVAWLLFSLEYTGNDRYLKRRYLALLSVIPVTTVGLAATTGHHDLLYAESTLLLREGTAYLSRTGGPWYWVVTGYTYLLGVLGAIPLLGLIRRDALPFRGQSLAILVGILAPGAINALFLLGAIPVRGLDPTPVGFAISGVAYFGAMKRFQLFRASPAPNPAARRLVFERMHDGAVVVDVNDTVVDANQNARDVLGTDPLDAIGQPAHDVVPGYADLPADGPADDHVTVNHGGRTRFFDPTVTRITDHRDRPLGRVIAFHDIGQHLRQNQRLEVLNRVLRHNIRNETNLIAGYADLVADPDVGEIIKERALRVEGLAEKARGIADLFEREGEPAVARPLGPLLERAVEATRREHPDVAVDLATPDPGVAVDGVLAPVLDDVVDNAARHNTSEDPWVEVRVETDEERVRIEVADNGPGIDEFERAVLESGEETPMAHGSGLGLWLITWGAQVAGGSVEFAVNRPTGSVVTLEVPLLSAAETEPREDDVEPLEGPA